MKKLYLATFISQNASHRRCNKELKELEEPLGCFRNGLGPFIDPKNHPMLHNPVFLISKGSIDGLEDIY